MKTSMLSCACGVGLVASVASGQATLTFSSQRAEANSYYVGPGPVGTFGLATNPPGTGNDFFAIEDSPANVGGFSGRGFSEEAVTFTPSNPGINGSFSSAVLEACTSAEIFTSRVPPVGPHIREESYGLASGLIEFSLSQPVGWTWNGVAQGTSYNTGSYHAVSAVFTLREINLGTTYVNLSNTTINGVGDFFNPFAFGGVLPAGDYRLTWLHESIATGGNTVYGNFPTAVGGAPLVSCIPSVFTITVPGPGAAVVLGLGGVLVVRRRRR